MTKYDKNAIKFRRKIKDNKKRKMRPENLEEEDEEGDNDDNNRVRRRRKSRRKIGRKMRPRIPIHPNEGKIFPGKTPPRKE